MSSLALLSLAYLEEEGVLLLIALLTAAITLGVERKSPDQKEKKPLALPLPIRMPPLNLASVS